MNINLTSASRVSDNFREKYGRKATVASEEEMSELLDEMKAWWEQRKHYESFKAHGYRMTYCNRPRVAITIKKQ